MRCSIVFPSRFRFMAGGLGLAAILAAPAAFAQTATLNVSAEVQASCILTGNSLDFGIYTTTGGSPSDSQTSFTYSCTEGTDISLTLDGGEGGGGDGRAMTGAGGELAYELHKTPARNDLWGIGTNGVEISDTELGEQAVFVYGRIPAGQQAAPGSYTDTVEILLTIN